MKKIYIFGIGKGKEIIKEYIRNENVEVLGYIDNYAGALTKKTDGKMVVALENIVEPYDYIVISVMRYQHILDQLLSTGIMREHIICFFSFDDAINEQYWDVIEKNGWRIEAMSFELQRKVRPYCQNLIYELYAENRNEQIRYPKIVSAEVAVEEIVNKKKSLVRFGDGEFELMRMRKRAKFQSVNRELANRLKQIIVADDENIMVALADNYGALGKYTDEAAEDIREYMAGDVRQEHMALIDMDKIYFDAYLSRPYILYRDKIMAGRRFSCLKKIWENRRILIVEGDKTRMGIGNDLFSQAEAIRRIVVPNENAFGKYDEILNCVRREAAEDVILIALGPTATVLAYDLAKMGFWAIDIGHIDLEYEWYCMKAQERCNIPYKYVNEVGKGEQVSDLPVELQELYEKEIVAWVP